MTWDEYKLECYYLGRYADVYQRQGTFNERTTALIQQGMEFQEQNGVAYLESMIRHSEDYHEMDRKLCPVLIYTGDPICYGVLDGFARELGYALDRLGVNVEFFDLETNGMEALADFAGKRFRAVIGFQTYAFSVLAGKHQKIHDLMEGPKFHMLLDHPVWLRNQLENAPEQDYYVLTHDRNYVEFIKRYYPSVKHTYLLPPAGSIYKKEPVEKTYDVSFIGSYHDWRLWKQQVREMNRKTHGIARQFLHHMLDHRHETWEQGLRETLEAMGRENLGDEEFRDLLFDIKPVCFIVMSYFREKIMDALVEANIPVHVFGDSWKQPRYVKAKNLIRHSALTPEESLEAYAKSRVSLNIMSWHKAGMTERIANMMLNHTVVVTDESDYIRENYVEGQDYIGISLDEIQKVPKILQSIVEDREKQKLIQDSAYEKAVEKETWDQRAQALLEILQEI